MAKKVVAGFKDKEKTKDYVKVIKMIKNTKGNYVFDEKIMRKDVYDNSKTILE